MCEGHESAIGKVQRQRAARLHHLGEGTDDEQHGLGVEGVGQKARAQGLRYAGSRCGNPVEADAPGVGQRLVAQVDQVTRAQHFHAQEQSRALADDHRDAQHRVQDVHLHSQGNAHGSSQPGLAALCITAAGDHGEVGTGADDGEQGEQGDGDEFGHGEGLDRR
ncbi:hypothetical protein D3C71_1611470 [compost metagenome]